MEEGKGDTHHMHNSMKVGVRMCLARMLLAELISAGRGGQIVKKHQSDLQI